MEDTFLERLADPTYGVPVVQSRFTSYPEVIPDAKWFAPDATSAFVPKLNGFIRKYVKTNDGNRLIAQEAMAIRKSYVDYRKRKIIIPPGGFFIVHVTTEISDPENPLQSSERMHISWV
jgi:hypothetical protein